MRGRVHTTWRPKLLSTGPSVSPESLTAGLWLPSLAPDISRGILGQLKSGVRQPPTQTLLLGALCSQSAQPEQAQPPTALQGTCCHLPAGAPCLPLRAPLASLAPAALGPGRSPTQSVQPLTFQSIFSARLLGPPSRALALPCMHAHPPAHTQHL